MKMPSSAAGEAFVLSADQPVLVRNVDERLVSYNIEMTEITGGTFWNSYTPEQIAGTEEFPVVGPLRDVTSMPDLTQYYPPIDLYHDRLRGLAKKLGPPCRLCQRPHQRTVDRRSGLCPLCGRQALDLCQQLRGRPSRWRSSGSDPGKENL